MSKPSTSTRYHKDTPNDLIPVLESARAGNDLIHIWYGDPKSGRAWEVPQRPGSDDDPFGYFSVGRISRHRKIKYAVLVIRGTRRVGLCEHHIVKLESAAGKVLWEHPRFNTSPSPVKY